jgi:hypothetical protein
VVIAIIAIIAGMLMPALATARENGKKMKCLSNLKQFGVNMQCYAGDNKGFLFPFLDYTRTPSVWWWNNYYHEYTKLPMKGKYYCPNSVYAKTNPIMYRSLQLQQAVQRMDTSRRIVCKHQRSFHFFN